jgi:hypothetical protein
MPDQITTGGIVGFTIGSFSPPRTLIISSFVSIKSVKDPVSIFEANVFIILKLGREKE